MTVESKIQADWDAAYSTFEGRLALHDLEVALGALANAQWDFDASRKGEAEKAIMQEAEMAFHIAYGEPLFQDVANLIATPAPTVAAAREKMHLVSHWGITDDLLPTPAVELIADDIERLTGVRKGGAA